MHFHLSSQPMHRRWFQLPNLHLQMLNLQKCPPRIAQVDKEASCFRNKSAQGRAYITATPASPYLVLLQAVFLFKKGLSEQDVCAPSILDGSFEESSAVTGKIFGYAGIADSICLFYYRNGGILTHCCRHKLWSWGLQHQYCIVCKSIFLNAELFSYLFIFICCNSLVKSGLSLVHFPSACIKQSFCQTKQSVGGCSLSWTSVSSVIMFSMKMRRHASVGIPMTFKYQPRH